MLKVRIARPDDADSIVELVRGGFDKKRLGTLIYGCRGMNRYIRQQLNAPGEISDTAFFVAENRGSLVGCAELRLHHDAIFLNVICTSSSHRGRGVGTKLLYDALVTVKKESQRKISLDVFCDNFPARSWYEQLGFKPEYYNAWWSIALSQRMARPQGQISGYALAEACQRVFGFSSLVLATSRNSYSIGRLANNWFRVTQQDILSDGEALSCLRILDDQRRLLGIFREDPQVVLPGNAEQICRSSRMTMKMDALLRKLSV